MLAIQPKYFAAKGAPPQIIIVEAFSPAQAEIIAIKKMQVGKYKNQKVWTITSNEELK